MSEFDKFMKSIDDKSEATKKQYRIQYNKLKGLVGKNIGDTSEKKIIEILDSIENKNNSQALLNISLLVRKLEGLGTEQLMKRRKTDKDKILEVAKENNTKLKESLPKYEDLVEYMDYLYEKNEWTDYIINYLLINFQVRNQDLNFDIVTRKKDANDPNKNYMWLQQSKARASYIRNVYKTATIIAPDGKDHGKGQKMNVIENPQFIFALRRVLGCQKSKLDCGTFIPNEASIHYYLQKATYKQLGEGNYFKIIVNHFRNDVDKLKEMAYNRGTDLKTILNSYDIDR